MNKDREKSNSLSINLSLAILGILALGLVASLVISFIPKEASAAAIYHPYNEPDENRDEPAETRSNPVPGVISLSPNSANIGPSAPVITITGNGFVPSSVARWNGSNRPTTFVDSSHLLVYLQAGDLYGASGKYISVFNPGPGGGYSNAALFPIKGYVAPGSQTSFAPSVSTSRSATGEVRGENISVSEEDKSFSTLAGNALYGSGVGLRPSGLTQWLIFAILVLLVVVVVRKLYFENKYHSTPLKHA